MNTQSRSEASSSGSYSNVSSSSSVILYPMISEPPTEGRNSSNRGVKWIGLHPLDMVERVVSMTRHSAHTKSTATSIDVGALMKRVGTSTTSPRCWTDTDAEATDDRCKSLVRSILDKSNRGTNDNLLSFGQATQPISIIQSAVPGHEEQLLRVANEHAGYSQHTSFGNLLPTKEEERPTTNVPKPSSAKEKNDMFQDKMDNWLIQNWTNPFPDTIELNYLASQLLRAQCIVVNAKDVQVLTGISQRSMINLTIKKIETYMVNVRLRKWRKSIEDAFDLKRPARLLLEDSLRLYEGKALRPIEGWNSDELFASHARYSLPLKAWKSKKKAAKKRSAKGSVGARGALAWQGVTPKRQRVASPKELTAGDGLISLAKGLKIMSIERKASPSDVVVKVVGGIGLSPMNLNIGVSPGLSLEDDARLKMKKGTFF